MHYLRIQNPYEEEKRKSAMFKMLSFCQKRIALVSNISMQMFNVYPLCIQSIRMLLEKKIEGFEFLIQALYKQYVE